MIKFWSYAFRRVFFLLPVIIGVSLIVFVISHIVPGDPAQMIGGFHATQEQVEKLRQEFGLNKPLHEQYYIYMKKLLFHGDLGTSLYSLRPVAEDIKTYFPATFELTTFAILLSVIFGIPLGVISATRNNTFEDHVTRMGSLAGLAMPPFWLGLLLQIVISYQLGLLPFRGRVDTVINASYPIKHITGLYLFDTLVTGNWAAFKDVVFHVLMPGLILSLAPMAQVVRIMRSSILEVLRQDYIVTAKGCGLPERSVIYKHALRNALIPTVTITGSMYGYMLGGSFVVESVFDWPGVGLYGVGAILNLDFPAIIGITLLYSALRIVSNLAVDLSYFFLDPQIKIEGKYKE